MLAVNLIGHIIVCSQDDRPVDLNDTPPMLCNKHSVRVLGSFSVKLPQLVTMTADWGKLTIRCNGWST